MKTSRDKNKPVTSIFIIHDKIYFDSGKTTYIFDNFVMLKVNVTWRRSPCFAEVSAWAAG